MKTVYFHDYQKSGDTGYDLYCMLNSLKGESGIRVVFDKDVYDVKPDYCFERNLCVSNHGWNGPKRMAVLIENMNDIELDFSDSVLRVNGIMSSVGILNSKNVSIKNVTLENPLTQVMQTKVIAHGDGYIELLKMHGKEQFRMRGDELVTDYIDGVAINIWWHVEYDAETGGLGRQGGDNSMQINICQEKIEEIDENTIRLYGIKRYPPIGNIIVMNASRRMGFGIFCEGAENVLCENVTVHSCMGMGFTAQMTKDITLRKFSTKMHDGRYWTANADATHFINCTGAVTVEDCFFEGQLDDALNIHGMYTKVVNKGEKEIFVKEIHEAAKGIRMFYPGEKIQILKPDTLIPYTCKTITDVEYINSDIVRLTVDETTEDVCVGDSAENISRYADLYFRRNTIQKNRARSILLASRGKIVVENNIFRSPACSIQFEANGDYWYESGGVQDVIIRNNRFEGCMYNRPTFVTICCCPRKAVEEGKYFHRKIQVLDNDFSLAGPRVVCFDNVETAVFKGNTFAVEGDEEARVEVFHVKNAEIQDDIKVEYK